MGLRPLEVIYMPCLVCGDSTKHRAPVPTGVIASQGLCRDRVCRVRVLGEKTADADSHRYLTERDPVERAFSDALFPTTTIPTSVAFGAAMPLSVLDCRCNPATAKDGRCITCGGMVTG